MGQTFDAVVAGGSVAGLAFAAEASARGLSVLVAEEHDQIGEPEKCDGLVSLRGFRRYGHVPRGEVVQNTISSALIHSPLGKKFAVGAGTLDVVVLRRSAYDLQLADEARKAGAEIVTGKRAAAASEGPDAVSVDVGGETVTARYFVDATGPSPRLRRGIIPAAKYEVEGEWIRDKVVEVYLDAERFPGFFAWVIPFGHKVAKVGAAGYGINAARALDAFLADKPHRVIRRVSAPIYVGGPADRFVKGRRVLVGESAGQVKPTTAGGIMTSMAGAVMAARWMKESVVQGSPALLANYQRDWEARFSREMRTMQRMRGMFSRLSNPDLDAIVMAVATPRIVMRLSQTDFDFHASALLGVLGLQGFLRVAKVVASSEIRALVGESQTAVAPQQSI